MASLVKCFECGHELSSDAKGCPNCSTVSPHGYKCAVCCQIGKRSGFDKNSLYRYYYSSDDGSLQTSVVKDIEMHQICFDKVQKEFKNSVSALASALHGYCPVCKNTFFYPKHNGGCLKCGHPRLEKSDSLDDTIIKCSHCNIGLLKRYAIYTVEGKEKYPSHVVCAENRPTSSCFIATAVYGKNSDEVEYLRNFRDQYLYSTKIGRSLMSLYNTISPPIANLLMRKFILRTLIRIFVITPVYKILKIFFPLNKD